MDRCFVAASNVQERLIARKYERKAVIIIADIRQIVNDIRIYIPAFV